jgi:site-specific recombinase XerD
MASLLYGSGLRLMECVCLRVKDIDFAQNQLTIREGKGDKDRVTMLPTSLHAPLQAQLEVVRALHQQDLAEGYGSVIFLKNLFQNSDSLLLCRQKERERAL